MNETNGSSTSMAANPSLVDRIKCPCDNFTAMSKIVEALNSEEKMESLVGWLDGNTDDLALKENKLLSCGKRSRCRFRYGISFAILNAIRDACRSHLEKLSFDEAGARASAKIIVDEAFSKQQQNQMMQPYEEAFPALTSSQKSVSKPQQAAANILVPRKKASTTTKLGSKGQPTSKRRIRPAQVTEPVEPSNFWISHSVAVSSVATPLLSVTRTSSDVWRGRNASMVAPASEDSLERIKKALVFSEVKEEVPDNALDTTSPITLVTVNSNKGLPSEFQDLPFVDVPVGNIDKASSRQFENLLCLYMTLFRNMLVPSTPLELHFLFRLLVLEKGSRPSGEDVVSFFQSIFATGRDCQQFAFQALRNLKDILRGLPIQLLQKLVQCEPFRQHCGDLVKELTGQLDSYKKNGLPMVYPTEAVTGTHAILSLPFDGERDSRHNYKTQAEIDVFRNREEHRDAFLHALRTFMGSKGKVFRPQDMEHSQDRVRHKARDIMNGLMSVNMMWFAQFYCDLLIQVGLAPVQETDQELLNITDEDKLQKLHKRFSSRSTYTSKSSKKISISNRPIGNSRLPIEEAHQLYTGYQEFFFLFIHELTFNFGFHLCGRMATMMLELLSDLSPKDLERKVMKLQLISRFLGYLVFSPNWHDASIDHSKIQSLALSNGLEQLENLGLSVGSHVQNAWIAGHLIATIPWVTELLKVAKWDSCTQASGKFRLLLADLRQIQKALGRPYENSPRFAASMQVVGFCLERFFDEACGLPRLTSLPQSQLGTVIYDAEDWLDGSPIGFSTVLLFAANPHIEDLLCLVDQSGKGLTNKSSSKARKLRPSVVSIGLDVEPSTLLSTGENGLLPTPVKGKTKERSDVLRTSDQRSIESRLAEGFFHQHRDLKEICDFAVGQVLREYPKRIVPDCIRFVLASQQMGSNGSWNDEDLSKILTSSYDKAVLALENSLEEKIGKALELFGPCDNDQRVIKIATRLSVTSAMLAGQSTLHSVIANKIQDVQHPRTAAQASLGVEDTSSKLAIAAIDSVAALFNATPGDHPPLLSRVVVEVNRACSAVCNLGRGSEMSIPTEAALRGIMSALLRLDKVGPQISQWCQSLSEECFLEVLVPLIRLILAVSTISSYRLPALVVALESKLVSRALEAERRVHRPEVRALLQELLEQDIIDSTISVGEDTVTLGAYLSATTSYF